MTVTPTPPVPIPGYDGCEWPVDPACFDTDWDALDPTVQARATTLAGNTLRRLTGYRVGGCPITVRPCQRGCPHGALPFYWDAVQGGPAWLPVLWAGTWINSCGCTTDCSCEPLCEVVLPAPVGEVYEVKVDGAPVTDFRVDGNRLVWTGAGACPWPTCQDLAAPDDQPGTFSVTYLNSYPVDQLGAYACAVLAMEFAQACIGNACRLPPGVTSVTRQGITFDVPTGTFPGGVTGIREVDAYLALWKPPGSPDRRSTVWSPDIGSARVVH